MIEPFENVGDKNARDKFGGGDILWRFSKAYIFHSLLSVSELSISAYFIPTGLKMTWAEAQDYCRAIGADSLAQIDDDAENRALKAVIEVNIDDTETYWIGINDRKVRRSFVWNDGNPITFTHWFIYEPQGWDQENCGMVMAKSKGRRWGDTDCNERKQFVCQRTFYEGNLKF